jgi:hypothetical protein
MILDGQPIPDNRPDVTHHLDEHIHEERHSTRYKDESFSIKNFRREWRVSHLSDWNGLIS